MKADLKQAFETEMATAYGLFRNGSLDEAFVHLEHAHVLGQRDVAPHVRSHWLMLRIGLARRAPTEISMFKRLPIAPEVQKIIEGK